MSDIIGVYETIGCYPIDNELIMRMPGLKSKEQTNRLLLV